MAETDKVAWLVASDGTRRRIGSQPLLLGRGLGCDVVVDHEEVSNRPALLRPTADGVEVEALGHNDTLLYGFPIRNPKKIRSGDRLEIPGSEFELQLERATVPRSLTMWFVRRGSLLHRVPGRPLSVGGGEGDDIQIAGWPPSLLELHAVGGNLLAEAAEVGVHAAGDELPVDVLVPLRSDTSVTFGAQAFAVVAQFVGFDQPTAGERKKLGLNTVKLEFLPNGAQLTLTVDGKPLTRVLSELRARLLSTLLQPSGEYEPGDFVPDELVLPQIWPRKPERTRTRTDLNTLVHRVRKDLLKIGVDPTSVIERAATGGATRFKLEPGVGVEVI